MKKIATVLIIVLVMTFATVGIVAAYDALTDYEISEELIVSEEDKISSFVEAITGDEDQGPVWFYLSEDGDGVRELFYTPSWGDNWQYSETPEADDVYYSIFDWNGFKVSAGIWGEKNIKTIIAWRAYEDGIAVIDEWDYTALDGNADLDGTVDGAVIKIYKGTEEIFSATTAAEGNIFEGTELAVNKNDLIFFVFDGKDASAANICIDTLSVELK